MTAIWWWLSDMTNSKITALLIFLATFIGILIYVYSNSRRGKRLESYRYIPLMDDADDPLIPSQSAKTMQPTQDEK